MRPRRSGVLPRYPAAAVLIVSLLLGTGCATAPGPVASATPTDQPTTSAGPTPGVTAEPRTQEPASPSSPAPLSLGAGFRFSTYGTYYTGPDYWVDVGRRMADRFPGSQPQAIWIVGNFAGRGTALTFPGSHADRLIAFSPEDRNEDALTRFDEAGFGVWLQVEPGRAPVDELIHLMLERYGHHPSVIGVGIDVEWFHSDGTPEGRAVTDDESGAWVAAARSHGTDYRLFLKHWEIGKMPPTERDGIVFVDDSQQFRGLDDLASEFAAWGAAFSPSPVGFQYGYRADSDWWTELDDPPGDIGDAILDGTPNTVGLFWVDFTVREVFPET